jgi:hypothetical protein
MKEMARAMIMIMTTRMHAPTPIFVASFSRGWGLVEGEGEACRLLFVGDVDEGIIDEDVVDIIGVVEDIDVLVGAEPAVLVDV